MPYNTTDISYAESRGFKDCCNLLLVIEKEHTGEILKVMKPIKGHHYIYRAYNYAETYYIGILGAYCVILSDYGKGQASDTIRNAINNWEPTTIIMLGDAFGRDREKQNIGDVLVVDHLIPFDRQLLNEKGNTYLSGHPLSGDILQDRLNSLGNWSFTIKKGLKAKLHIGPLLTGSVDVQSKNFKNNLFNQFPKAIGGDVDAKGVYEAVKTNYPNRNIEWIIIKGFSHFGDGEAKNQKKAIRSAIDFTRAKFCNKVAFNDLKLVLSEKCNVDIPLSAPPPPRFLYKNRPGLFGYKDANNKVVISCIYLDGKEFKEGLANVKMKVSEETRIHYIEKQVNVGHPLKEIRKELENLGCWGYIDIDGNTVIEHIYDKAFPFKNGKAKVVKDGKGLYINKKGEIIV
ncbi:MAG: WG repeat-containing protein [Chitinophagales bacterium]|nr:WG repeat-containing protein [Chitinophagales bacterium]